MPLITREELDNQLVLRRQTVDVPEWSTPGMVARGEVAQVLIQELMGTDRDDYESSIFTQVGQGRNAQRQLNLKNARAKLVARAMIDEQGNRLYKDNEVHLLGQKPAAGLERVFDAVRKMNGITDEDEKELEEAIENFPQGQKNGSGIA